MTIGKIEKVLNKWQFRLFIGWDYSSYRRGRFELWIFSLTEIPKQNAAMDKKQYKGIIFGRSFRVPNLLYPKKLR